MCMCVWIRRMCMDVHVHRPPRRHARDPLSVVPRFMTFARLVSKLVVPRITHDCPRFRALASRMRFTDLHAGASVCTPTPPSRAAL